MATKKKLLTSGVAVVAAVGVLFGGTFAWQSISQTALNEVSASVNPGGRLHDDFHEITETLKAEAKTGDIVTSTYDKNVYVENFTEYTTNGAEVYARVRLDEYMELGQNAGKLNADGKKDTSNTAKSVVDGAELDDKTTWTTHVLGQEDDETNPFHQYWSWELGGDAVTYMPTFNKNKDSLEADINGSFAAGFEDYVDYGDEANASKTANAIYDKDNAGVDETGKQNPEVDEIVNNKLTASQFINAADEDTLNTLKDQITDCDDHIELLEETHEARETLSFENDDMQIISMATYKQWVADGFKGTGNFWVYDEDGWAYWAAPIKPESATAPLLNGISRTEKIISQDWYYAINVVAQFITYDDMGQDDNTGFYDLTQGTYPTADALALLKTIGVEVPEAEVSDLDGLKAALEQGGIITLTDDINVTEPLNVSASCVLDLGDYTLSAENDIWSDEKESSALLYVDGATVIINGGTFAAKENDSYALTVAGGGKVVIYDGIFKGNMDCVYVHKGEVVIYGGTFSIQQTNPTSGKEYEYVLNCLDENYADGTAKITVYGGEFERFDPSNCLAEGEGTNFVADGYVSTPEGDWYTVAPATADSET